MCYFINCSIDIAIKEEKGIDQRNDSTKEERKKSKWKSIKKKVKLYIN